jgi:LysR family transcriptional regulator, carnitine catabolism transcriptional activator
VSQINSQRLAYFVAIVDHGGFTAAARAIFVSQPALSLAVKELERELGTPLFARVGRGTRLTAAGEALLGPARQVLHDLESGRAAVAAVTGLVSGSLSLASLPTLAVEPMAQLVGSFRRLHPGIRVDLAAPEDSRDLFALVEQGNCELGLTDSRTAPVDLRVVDLGTQELVLILPPGGVEPAAAGPARPDMARVPLVVAPEGTSTRRLLDEHLESVGVRPNLAVVAAQRDALLPLVLAGAGAALVPEAMARVAGVLGAVVVPLDPPAVRSIGLVHRDADLSPAASRFVEVATGSAGAAG